MKNRIGIWGLFGQENIGNECTLKAFLYNIRLRVENRDLFLICTEPDEAATLHGLTALPFSTRDQQSSFRAGPRTVFSKALAFLFVKIPCELSDVWHAFQTLKKEDMVLMTGTGMLTDYNSDAFGWPYEIFKWAILARLRGSKLAFVSVGVGPLYSAWSRLFILAALRLADFRSYRDEISRERISKAGLQLGDKDLVYPDLAFSLPEELFHPVKHEPGERPLVAVGVMGYYGERAEVADGESIYWAFLNKIADLVTWLQANNFRVRIIHGDNRYDQKPRGDLRKCLESRGSPYDRQNILDEDFSTTEELVHILAAADLVISPRFHNQLLALMLGKPVISISYDPKSDSLLDGVGLGRFCQPIGTLDIPLLIEQFRELRSNFSAIEPLVLKRVHEYRKKLDEQYALILCEFEESV